MNRTDTRAAGQSFIRSSSSFIKFHIHKSFTFPKAAPTQVRRYGDDSVGNDTIMASAPYLSWSKKIYPSSTRMQGSMVHKYLQHHRKSQRVSSEIRNPQIHSKALAWIRLAETWNPKRGESSGLLHLKAEVLAEVVSATTLSRPIRRSWNGAANSEHSLLIVRDIIFIWHTCEYHSSQRIAAVLQFK
jgi:hypothetical protein